MLNDDPVTLWIDELRDADHDAAQKIWNHFVKRLHVLARKTIAPDTRPVYDEADAAQSAFRSFCLGVSAGRFPDLQDRAGLWRLLLTITSRKIARQHERDHRQCRDVNRRLSDHIFNNASGDSLLIGVGQCTSREPTPEFAAEFAETCETFFHSLDDSQLQQLVSLRMEGYNDDEIAERLNCSRRTVQRRLDIIRRRWSKLELSIG